MNLITRAVICGLAIGVAVGIGYRACRSADYGSPDLSAYYASLMQPDAPYRSCCGEADAYYADEVDQGPDGSLIAIITDTRPDEPRERQHVPPGTRVVVPPFKIRKHPVPNPTDHTIIFLSKTLDVYCYEPLPGL